MGLTRLCDINTKLSPQKWADLILESYRHHGDGTLPDYIRNSIRSKKRNFPEDKLFGTWNRADKTYNAFEKDISSATFLDFLSQVGGILGLCVGISLTSVIEIIYWLSFNLADKTTKLFKLRHSAKNSEVI
jgi:hypothetical protein